MPTLVRIAVVTSTTQLLPLIHILKREPGEGVRDVLLVAAISGTREGVEAGTRLMERIAAAYPFAAVIRIDHLENAKVRSNGGLPWPAEFVRRNRKDARELRRVLAPHLRGASRVEVWSDEAVHWPVPLVHALFPRAVHVKAPHSFNLDARTSYIWREFALEKARAKVSPARRLLWAATKLASGVSYRAETGLAFDRAYSFDAPSPWSRDSVDVSDSISLDALAETYEALPASLRAEVVERVTEARGGSDKRWILVVLLALDEASIGGYVRSMRTVLERNPELARTHRVVVKPHPTTLTPLRHTLVRELSALRVDVGLFDSQLNLDILWHLLPVDVVVAGPCGSVPIVRRLGNARVLILGDLTDALIRDFPIWEQDFNGIVEGFERV